MNNQSLSIRPIAAGDRSEWEKLFLDYGVFYKTEFSPTVTDGVWAWLMNPDHPVEAWVATRDDTILGFAHLAEQHDTFSAGPSWFLDDLFTTPAARGQGIATALIAALKEHALLNGGGTIRWITGADNTTAQRVYDTLATKTTWVMYEDEIKAGN